MNPAYGAHEYPDNLQFEPLKRVNDDEDEFWGCPVCNDDGYLVDDLPQREKDLILLKYKTDYTMNGKKAKVIVIVRGGMIQHVITNRPIEFVNLDWDIFDGDSIPFEEDDYAGRHYDGPNIEVCGPVKFKKIEEDLQKQWDEAHKNAIKEPE